MRLLPILPALALLVLGACSSSEQATTDEAPGTDNAAVANATDTAQEPAPAEQAALPEVRYYLLSKG